MEYVIWLGIDLGVVALVLAITLFIERRRQDWRDPATATAVAVMVYTLAASELLDAIGPLPGPLWLALLVVAGGAAWWRGVRWVLPLLAAPIFLLSAFALVSIAWVLLDTTGRSMAVLLLGASLAAGIMGRRGRSRS